jgi:hypothetical protein
VHPNILSDLARSQSDDLIATARTDGLVRSARRGHRRREHIRRPRFVALFRRQSPRRAHAPSVFRA